MTDKKTLEEIRKTLPNSEEFSRTLGHVTWLMTLSPEHRKKPIAHIEAHVSAPMMFKQVRVYTKGKQPVAAILWAYVSEEVQEKLDAGDYTMSLQDWRSGDKVTIVECISPLLDPDLFVNEFMNQVVELQETKNSSR